MAHSLGSGDIEFEPSTVEPNLPPAHSTLWPMGDVLSQDAWPSGVDVEMAQRALDTGLAPLRPALWSCRYLSGSHIR